MHCNSIRSLYRNKQELVHDEHFFSTIFCIRLCADLSLHFHDFAFHDVFKNRLIFSKCPFPSIGSLTFPLSKFLLENGNYTIFTSSSQHSVHVRHFTYVCTKAFVRDTFTLCFSGFPYVVIRSASRPHTNMPFCHFVLHMCFKCVIDCFFTPEVLDFGSDNAPVPHIFIICTLAFTYSIQTPSLLDFFLPSSFNFVITRRFTLEVHFPLCFDHFPLSIIKLSSNPGLLDPHTATSCMYLRIRCFSYSPYFVFHFV